MYNVFISKPNWIEKKFEKGFQNFLKFLKTHDLKPRTLGESDYPNECPLDEVIRIMNDCQGAIILGYPQIELVSGKIKNKTVRDINLATEWNHIETGLAYAKNLPIMVIHHEGIIRGIFDRGTLNKFIYSLDLKNPSWSLLTNFSGAFSHWKINLEKYSQLNSKIGINGLIDLLESKGFDVKKDGTFLCGVENSEIAMYLIIDGVKISASRFSTIEFAREKTETYNNEEYYQFNHWVLNNLSKEIKTKLKRTLSKGS